MKRDRDGDATQGSGPSRITPAAHPPQIATGSSDSRYVRSPTPPPSVPLPRSHALNGVVNGNGAPTSKVNGTAAASGNGAGKKPRVNGDPQAPRPLAIPPVPSPTGGTTSCSPSTSTPAPSSASSLPSNPSSSSSSSSSASSFKRARLGIIQPPEGWREVAEGILKGKGSVSTAAAEEGEVIEEGPKSCRSYAAVCSANFNRSMMAHKLMQKHGFRVQSYGTGRDVRLPGKDVGTPEVFPFGTPYLEIYDTLKGKDEDFFRRNNLLGLVARNAGIKKAPERFQDIPGPDVANFDVVLCFDSRVFYLVVEDLQSRDPETFKPLHVVNMTIKDSPEESAAAAGDVLDLCRTLDALTALEDEASEVLDTFAKKTKRTILHQVCHV